MRINIAGSTAYLEGDWTLPEVTKSALDSLACAFQQIGSGGERKLQIDCRDVSTIDTTGLHLLERWVHCVRLLGMEPELIISTNHLRISFQSLRIHCN